ncbi:HAD family phosphatase [Streptomyces sp. NPDC006552]|uniref:HAD family phosphatase n=1 Tax=Streptomyces sp. NPDC006552 TaxID=3157179 RepID=UPI00339DB13F
MGDKFVRLRLVALNIDGVLLNDSFSPVIHRFVTGRGAAYTVDTERAVFSQQRRLAGVGLAAAVGGSLSGEEALAAYFEERDQYLLEHPVEVRQGTVELLHRLRGLGLRTVCYGGLGREHFTAFLGEHADLFDTPGYICTDAFRPGLHEIATEFFGLAHDQVLVVDDVARVAEEARLLGMPFVGLPSFFEHGHQRALMREAGVRRLVEGLDALDEPLLRALDREATAGTLWGE